MRWNGAEAREYVGTILGFGSKAVKPSTTKPTMHHMSDWSKASGFALSFLSTGTQYL
jgi:hypothetical protein